MESWVNKKTFHERLAKSMSDDSTHSDLPDLQLDPEVAQWLGKLSLLYGVPLEYLVPDSRMLPPESIRFFYLDKNWTDRLLDGALSVGVLSTKEQIFNKTFFNKIYQATDLAQQNTRALIRNKIPEVPTHIGGTITGLLIRSRVVSDYPGLEIKGTTNSGENELKILRMDRLSDTLIICLFDGKPDKVEFIQPSEGLHFGIPQFFINEPNRNTILLRGLGFNGISGGDQIITNDGKENVSVHVPLTETAKGVLDITQLVENITDKFKSLPKNPMGDLSELGAGGFAIQMVVTQQIQEYMLKTSEGETPDDCN